MEEIETYEGVKVMLIELERLGHRQKIDLKNSYAIALLMDQGWRTTGNWELNGEY